MEEGKSLGMTTVQSVGYAKLDPFFNGEWTSKMSDDLSLKIDLDPTKKTLLFSGTWDKSGMSGVEFWYNKLDEFAPKYNVLVTLHHMMSKEIVDYVKQTENIYFINDKNVLPYMTISDVLISDTSSIIGEFCAFNKPIITFKTKTADRFTDEIKQLIQDISFQISSVSELKIHLESFLQNTRIHEDNRKKYNLIMFDLLDGMAGKRMSDIIKKLI